MSATERSGPPTTPREGAQSLAAWARDRSAALDNLKVLVIVAVIGMHGWLGYVAVSGAPWWPYAEVQETQISAAATATLFVVAGPWALFMMALMFSVSGLVSGRSIAKKGPGRFARDRLVRLGLPYAAYVLMWPLVLLGMRELAGGDAATVPQTFAATFPAAGPAWFVGALLVFSLAYAAWDRLWPGRPPAPLTTRRLVGLAGAMATASFALRLTMPYASETPLALEEWQWPTCAGLFVVGVLGSQQGWLTGVPPSVRRSSFRLMAAGFIGALLLVVMVAGMGTPVTDFFGGWNASAASFAAAEALLTVFGTIWLLASAQQVLDHRFRLGPTLARSAFLAYLVQPFVLIGIALVLRSLPLVAEVKAGIVSLGGVALCFALAWWLIEHVGWVRRIV